MRRVVVALAAILVLVTQLGAGGRTYTRIYKAYTRELFVYHDFGTALIARGTLLEGAMRDAMADERRRRMDPTPEDDARFRAGMREDLRTFHEVVFSADSGLPAGREFGEDGRGWRLRLTADGKREELVTLVRVRRPSTLQRALFAHFTIWSQFWIARFHRTVERPDIVELHFGSGYGNGAMRWEGLATARSAPRR